jgi:O-acetylserine/cysteine efflux transporter
MSPDLRRATAALTAAGLLWGTTVPLSKVALEWLPPGWLTFARFGVAAVILLVAARSRIRAACTPAVLACGAVGYGGSVLVQNVGITRTSVSHAALLIGAAPVLVAVIAAIWRRTIARPVAWAGFAVSLAGVGMVTGGPGGGATVSGDGLVLASLLMSAMFTVAQTGLLRGRDPVAVTAVQFLAAALAVLPVAVATEGVPAVPSSAGTILACAGLALGGTLLPFTLFAYGQSRVAAEVAGAFLNLEPLVGAVAGVVVFSDPMGPHQVLGGAAILAGIAMGSRPLLASRQREPAAGDARIAVAAVPAVPAVRAEPGARSHPRRGSALILNEVTRQSDASDRHRGLVTLPARSGYPVDPPGGRARYRNRTSRGPVTRCTGHVAGGRRVLERSVRRAGRRPVQRGRQGSLEDQQPALDLYARPAAETAQPVSGHHPVARHDQRIRVRSHELADGPRWQGHAGRTGLGKSGKIPVGDGLTEPD